MTDKRWATMHDVARRAGVSQKTVSRVINGEQTVRDDTVALVLDAAEQLGYRRNDGARLLRQGTSSASLGIVTEDLAGPFYGELLTSVQRTVQHHDYLLLTGSAAGESHRFYSLLRAFVLRRVDGLLVAPTAADDVSITNELVGGLPCVFVDRPPSNGAIDSVVSDNGGGTRDAVRHLFDHGHRRIGFIGDDPGFWTARQRLDGFLSALNALGLSTEYVHMAPADSRVTPGWATDERGPTAIVTGNATITLRQLLRRRDHPDERGALIGFDDVEYADLPDPALTVIAQQARRIGETASGLLFDRINRADAPARALTIPTRLIARGSGEVGPPSGA
ncbi:LacI family DNA-binding transcriptional regulator [Spelaeicoccus albus]|uniref:LacI family transcriptional regulator n=1 Tax=Spelaeicoccus albus TaxID=1280376 RepID=A0A7Z0IJ65_9MICO|nr:LacI family DNA-binding transcriptional regulator [Spelaeicoccus albus]NYI69199.1 LacI family transcriptional regulator [Spelaeicoccus albus]